MPYTVQIHEWTSTGQRTNKTGGSIRFKNANNPNVDTDDAMIRQTTGGGTDFSFEKYTQAKITALTTSASTGTVVSGLKFYTDGSEGFGVGVAMFTRSASTFATPVAPASATAFTGSFTYVSTAALALSTATFSTTGYFGDFAIHMVRVTTGVVAGLTPSETATYAYDETT